MSLAGAIILLVGDSWAAGPPGAALADALRAEGAVVTVDGVVGRSANSLVGEMRALLEEIDRVHPDHVIFLIGVNDVVGKRTYDSYVALYASVTSAGPEAWVVSNATMPGTQYRDRVLQVERMQREVFGTHALAGATLADAAWFDHTSYHLVPEAATQWSAVVAPLVARLVDGQSGPIARVGRALLNIVPFADRWLA